MTDRTDPKPVDSAVGTAKSPDNSDRQSTWQHLLFLMIALCLPASLPASDLSQLKLLSLEQLGNIEVTIAGRSPQKQQDVAAAVHVISRQQILNSGATSVPELLRLVPGMHVARLDNNKWSIASRGFSSRITNKLLVMIDGRSVYSPLFGGVLWDQQGVMIEDLQRIEIIRGPGASIWGANAVNGVINIISRKASETQGQYVGLVAGEGTEQIMFRHGGTLGDSGHYRLYGQSQYQPESAALNGGGADDEGDELRTGFRLDWLAGQQNEFTLQGDLYRSNLSEKLQRLTIAPPFNESFKDDIDLKGGNLLGRWNRDNGDGDSTTWQFYIDYAERDQHILRQNRFTLDLDYDRQLTPSNRHSLTWGINYRYTRDKLPLGDLAEVQLRLFSPESRSDELFSLFLQDEITLVPDRWWLTLGSKFESNDYTGFEYQPSARLRWTPSDTTTYWAAISRAVRTPTRAESDGAMILGLADPGPPPQALGLIGNDNLDAERLLAYELGFRYQPSAQLKIDLALFYNDYDSLVSSEFFSPIPIPSPIFDQYIENATALIPPGLSAIILANRSDNQAYGETWGGELVVDWHPHDQINLQFGYSLLKTALHVSSGSSSQRHLVEEGSSPEQQFRIDMGYQTTPSTRIDLALRHVDQLAALNVDSYTELDAHFNWRLTRKLDLSLVGRNLLDKQHLETRPSFFATELTENERQFHLRVNYRF